MSTSNRYKRSKSRATQLSQEKSLKKMKKRNADVDSADACGSSVGHIDVDEYLTTNTVSHCNLDDDVLEDDDDDCSFGSDPLRYVVDSFLVAELLCFDSFSLFWHRKAGIYTADELIRITRSKLMLYQNLCKEYMNVVKNRLRLNSAMRTGAFSHTGAPLLNCLAKTFMLLYYQM